MTDVFIDVKNEVLPLFDNSFNPESELEKKEVYISILNVIRFLPKQEQDVLALRYWAGFSYAEIARQLKTTTLAVGVSIHRARKKLKANIELEEIKKFAPN